MEARARVEPSLAIMTHRFLSTSIALAGVVCVLMPRASAQQPLTWEQRQALIPRFEADIRLLEVITGEDFGDWLQPRGDSGGLVGARPAGQRQARNGQPRSF